MGFWRGIFAKRKKKLVIPSHRAYASEEKKGFAKSLRNNQTEAEKIIWAELRKKKLGFKFRRQALMFGWIVDFYCPQKLLIIEIDGEYHNKQKEEDIMRDNILNERGFKTIRFTNTQIINNLTGVIQTIKAELSKG